MLQLHSIVCMCMIASICVDLSVDKRVIQSGGYLGSYESLGENWAINCPGHDRLKVSTFEKKHYPNCFCRGQMTFIHVEIAMLASCFFLFFFCIMHGMYIFGTFYYRMEIIMYKYSEIICIVDFLIIYGYLQ